MRAPARPVACIVAVLLGLGAVLAGCDNMAKQPVDKTWRPADTERTTGARTWPPVPPPDIIARDDGPRPPPRLTPPLLARGQQRYGIYCAPCHGDTGFGDGMIARRGFPAPPSFHDDRLRQVPTRHIIDVITNGWGVMYSYADRVPPDDRWAIAAYIRALQDSRHVAVTDLPTPEREALERQTAPREAGP